MHEQEEAEEEEEEEEEVEAAAPIDAAWPMTGTAPLIVTLRLLLSLLIAGSAGRVGQITEPEGDRRRWLEEATGAADALRLLARSSARKSVSLRAALWRAAQTQSRTMRDASRFRSAQASRRSCFGVKQARLHQRRRGAEEEEGEEAEGGEEEGGWVREGGKTGASLCRNSTGKGEGRRATRVVGSCARGVWAIWRTGVKDSTPSLPSHPRHRHSTRGAEVSKESEGRLAFGRLSRRAPHSPWSSVHRVASNGRVGDQSGGRGGEGQLFARSHARSTFVSLSHSSCEAWLS